MALPKPPGERSPDYESKNPKRAAKRGAEPEYPKCDPEPPAQLGEFGRNRWHYFFTLLDSQGVMTAADRDTLAMYCKALEDENEAHETIRKDGLTVMGKYGMSKHCLLSQINSFRDSILRHATALGFTPASRNKTRAGDNGEEVTSEFDDD